MTPRWWMLAAVVLPGGSLIVLGAWLRRRWLAREAARIDALIRSPRPVFLGADEGLEVRARARREIAEQIRKRSSMVASGASSASVLKIARKA